MAEDYATLKNRPPTRPAPWRTFVIALLGVLLLLGSFVIGFHFGEHHGKEVAAGEERRRLMAQLARQRKENEKLRKQLEEARALARDAPVRSFGEDRLLFFEELVNEPVKPAPLSEPSSPGQRKAKDEIADIIEHPPAPVQPAQDISAPPVPLVGRWVVQAASFRKREDADALAARIKHKGFRVFIRQADLGTRGVWHRVYLGPFPARRQAEEARERLYRELGLRGFVSHVAPR